MGAPYGRTLGQWSKGEYIGANNFEDDLAIIAKGMSYRTSDNGGLANPRVVRI